MKILHCISTLEVGGAERQLGIIAAAQSRSGSSVHVAFLRDGLNRKVLEQGGVHLHQIAHSGNLDPMLPIRLLTLVRHLRPTILQTWLTQMDVLAGLAARATATPWIIAERSAGEAYHAGWRQSLRSYLARRADLIIANSRGGSDYWRSHAPGTACDIIGNAVLLDQIRGAIPAELPSRSVLFVGRLAAEKRVHSLIRGYAAAPASAVGPLLICGDGPERVSLEALAESLGIRHRVQFLGVRDDIWSLLLGATAVANPSAFEGCPNAVIEAMAAQRPVIVSDIPAHKDIATDREAALVDPNDAAAFSAAIVEAVSGSTLVRERVIRARMRVDSLSVDAILNAYQAAYHSVLSRQQRS